MRRFVIAGPSRAQSPQPGPSRANDDKENIPGDINNIADPLLCLPKSIRLALGGNETPAAAAEYDAVYFDFLMPTSVRIALDECVGKLLHSEWPEGEATATLLSSVRRVDPVPFWSPSLDRLEPSRLRDQWRWDRVRFAVKALSHLELSPGDRFLHVDADIDAGYVNAVAAPLLGPDGLNHGLVRCHARRAHATALVRLARRLLVTEPGAPVRAEPIILSRLPWGAEYNKVLLCARTDLGDPPPVRLAEGGRMFSAREGVAKSCVFVVGGRKSTKSGMHIGLVFHLMMRHPGNVWHHSEIPPRNPFETASLEAVNVHHGMSEAEAVGRAEEGWGQPESLQALALRRLCQVRDRLTASALNREQRRNLTVPLALHVFVEHSTSNLFANAHAVERAVGLLKAQSASGPNRHRSVLEVVLCCRRVLGEFLRYQFRPLIAAAVTGPELPMSTCMGLEDSVHLFVVRWRVHNLLSAFEMAKPGYSGLFLLDALAKAFVGDTQRPGLRLYSAPNPQGRRQLARDVGACVARIIVDGEMLINLARSSRKLEATKAAEKLEVVVRRFRSSVFNHNLATLVALPRFLRPFQSQFETFSSAVSDRGFKGFKEDLEFGLRFALESIGSNLLMRAEEELPGPSPTTSDSADQRRKRRPIDNQPEWRGGKALSSDYRESVIQELQRLTSGTPPPPLSVYELVACRLVDDVQQMLCRVAERSVMSEAARLVVDEVHYVRRTLSDVPTEIQDRLLRVLRSPDVTTHW